MGYRCADCGELHEGLPDIGSDYPSPYWDVPEDERSRRIDLTSDTCVIDGEEFFIRGVLELPITDAAEHGLTGENRRFGFGVWVSQKDENFAAYRREPNSSAIGPFFGWLCTHIGFYQAETLNLKTRAHFRGADLRPAIELEPTDHPLAIDQHVGIRLARAWEIVHWYEQLQN